MKTMRVLLLAATLTVTASACGPNATSHTWVASIYPAQFITAAIAQDEVELLTAPGVEPHDLELTAADIVTINTAQLFVFASSVQPAVDDAAGDNSFDIVTGNDPHIWLDPHALRDVVVKLTERMIDVQPESETEFVKNSTKLITELEKLDSEFESGLSQCARTEIISTHNAFSFMAQRYGLTAVPIAGNDPHGEPSAARIAEITQLIKSSKATTIFAEPLAPHPITTTLADESSVHIAVLDPIEGLTPGSTNDYFSIMRANLAALRSGLDCQ